VLHAAENLNADEKYGVSVALVQSLECSSPEVNLKLARLQGCDRDYNL